MFTGLRKLGARLWAVVRRDAEDREFGEELESHLAMAEERFVRRGMTPEEAHRAAVIELGGLTQLSEAHRRTRGLPILESVQLDLRSALRGLRAAPGFTAVVLAVLTLAMGATTAVFSVVDALALKGLPFDDADRIVSVGTVIKGKRFEGPFMAPDYLELRAQQDVFASLAAVTDGDVPLLREGANDPEVLPGQRVSAEFFAVLMARPTLGRSFTTENEVEGNSKVAVISHGLWQRRFGGAPNVIGMRLPTDDGGLEVIGVMPARFSYPVGELEPTDVWRPYVIPDKERTARFSSYLRLIARLKNDLSLESAQTRLDALAASNATNSIPGGLTWHPALTSLRESLVGDTRPWMLMLLGAVICVLLIACVNIANLMLVRTSTRVRELSVRSALGATRWALGRMLLVESLVLSTAGTAFGLLLAYWGVAALQSLLPPYLPRLADVAIDWRVLTVAAGAAVVTGIAFGLAPVFQSARSFDHALRETGRTDTSSSRRQWLRTGLLVAEVALAVVLVMGAALFLTSFSRLMRIDLGLDYNRVLVVNVSPRDGSSARFTTLLSRVSQIPGVEIASFATGNLPFSNRRSTNFKGVGVSEVSADYFRALGMPLRSGRLFDDADGRRTRVVILNEAAAKVYFPDQDPIGRTISGSSVVIGVVGNVRSRGPENKIEPDQYSPATEADIRRATFVLKTRDGDDGAIAEQVKAAIWREFPDVIIPPPQTLERALGGFIAQRRFNMVLLSLFGILGLTIAAMGIYGVMSYIVTQRTREIGIRMALGALASTVLWSVLRRAGTQVGVGLILGFAMSWVLATSIETFLFNVEPRDFRLYAGVCAVLAFTALAAAYIPARRAARVDPLVALRLE